MIFSVYLQVGDLGRSLSFYRDGRGLEVAWNDDMLAVLHGPDGLSVVLFLPGEPSLAGKPPPYIYWYH